MIPAITQPLPRDQKIFFPLASVLGQIGGCPGIQMLFGVVETAGGLGPFLVEIRQCIFCHRWLHTSAPK